jgi:hypothetical protein
MIYNIYRIITWLILRLVKAFTIISALIVFYGLLEAYNMSEPLTINDVLTPEVAMRFVDLIKWLTLVAFGIILSIDILIFKRFHIVNRKLAFRTEPF